MKDIRCVLGHHVYRSDMVVTFLNEDATNWYFKTRMRCVRCGKMREDILPVAKWPKEGK